ncbi:MAG TPA: zinc-ribbon domain-containing protein, partial [Armatimonadota bacterium]|nr:zinc-ribbon domain-containing protein [Armatimonadota bacterium]
MHCPNCQAAVPAGSRFCNRCGAPVAAAPPAPPHPAQPHPAHPHPAQPTQAYGPRTLHGQPGQAPPNPNVTRQYAAPPPTPAAP